MSIPRLDLPRKLCARYKREFAHPTIKDRLPAIATKIVDRLYVNREEVKKQYGEEGSEELKAIIGECSKLKNEIQTNKPLALLEDDLDDVTQWNDRLSLKVMEENEWRLADDSGEEVCVEAPTEDTPAAWFHSSWLLAEAYFYRRLASIPRKFKHLKNLDLFREPKETGTTGSKVASAALASYLLPAVEDLASDAKANEDLFRALLLASLWGNKCDLSISAGADNYQTQDILQQLDSLSGNIVSNQVDAVWKFVSSFKNKSHPSSKKQLKRFDIILDNTGFELITDLCLADLMTALFSCQVRFHAKQIPWFVSDVTPDDFDWTLKWMGACGDEGLGRLHRRWQDHVTAGRWVVETHPFWSYPHSFHSLRQEAASLYEHLSHADLLLFKGDLNYRKLTGDRRWDYSEKFERAVGDFRPAPLLSLRTLKCDLVLDVPKQLIAEQDASNPDWMLFGTHAVIQFLPSL